MSSIAQNALEKYFSDSDYLDRIKFHEKKLSNYLINEIKTPIDQLFNKNILTAQGLNKIKNILKYYKDYTYYVDTLGFLFQVYYVEIYKNKLQNSLKEKSEMQKEAIFNLAISSSRKTNYEKYLTDIYNYINYPDEEKLLEISNRSYWLIHDYLGKIIDSKYIKNQIEEIRKRGIHKLKFDLEEAGERIRNIKKIKQKLPPKTRQIVGLLQNLLYLYNEKKKEVLNKVNIYICQVVEYRFSTQDLSQIQRFMQFSPEEWVDLLRNPESKFLEQLGRDRVYGMIHGKIYREEKKYLKLISVFDKIKILKGKPASPGYARGKVNIILNISHIPKFKEGEILVAPYTNINYLPIMRKTKAILTETGGLTCHAAIVSRELKIPCIVGIPNILSVLKDGDRVEIDASKGIVKKL